MTDLVFKIVDRASWEAVSGATSFDGSPLDARDGFIHLSSAAQVRDTAARYFAGQRDLLLVAVDVASMGGALRWEPSRNGELFPHLYGSLPSRAVRWVAELPLDAAGRHTFPDLES